MQQSAATRRQKSYSPPRFKTLDREQVAIILLGQAWDGNKSAKELLQRAADVLFPSSSEKKRITISPQDLHDIRNKLHVIIGFADLLRGNEIDEAIRYGLDQILSAARKMAEILGKD